MAQVSVESRELIERLIAFDTTSRNSNLELIEYIRDYLKGLGVESELVYDAGGAKANLYATLGPTDRWPGLDARSLEGRGAGRQALWSRNLRHEELHRHLPGLGAPLSRKGQVTADPLLLYL